MVMIDNENVCKKILQELERIKNFYIKNENDTWSLGVMHGIIESENAIYNILIGKK